MVGALVGAFGVQAWRGLSRGEIPPPRSFLGLVVVTVMLGVGSSFSPELASGFAILVFLAVLLGAFDSPVPAVGGGVSSKKK